MTDVAQAMVEYFEQCRLKAYIDTNGYWTNGWGHMLGLSTPATDAKYRGLVWTQDQADEQLGKDMSTARLTATRFPYYYQLGEIQQAVLTSMCFQMGPKPLYWPHFIAALEARDYKAAAVAGLDSDWADHDSPARAQLEMSMLVSNTWEIPT